MALRSKHEDLRGPEMIEKASFRTLLKHYRQAAGVSQEALAARAGLSARAISDLERGINRTPRYATLELLSSACSCLHSSRPCCRPLLAQTLPLLWMLLRDRPYLVCHFLRPASLVVSRNAPVPLPCCVATIPTCSA